MSRLRLTKAVAADTHQPIRRVEGTLDAFLRRLVETLAEDERVTLGGFGTFRLARRKTRTGRNPQTGEPLVIPAARVVRFKAGRGLRRAIR